MLLGEFGTKTCLKNMLIGRVDAALTGYVGVELGCGIATSSSVGIQEYMGIFKFHLDHLQHT